MPGSVSRSFQDLKDAWFWVTAGSVSNRFRGFKDQIWKLSAIGARLCCVLLMGSKDAHHPSGKRKVG
jgi:hypothetical protein